MKGKTAAPGAGSGQDLAPHARHGQAADVDVATGVVTRIYVGDGFYNRVRE